MNAISQPVIIQSAGACILSCSVTNF